MQELRPTILAIGLLLLSTAGTAQTPSECDCQPDDIKRLGLPVAIAEAKGARYDAAIRVLGLTRGGKSVLECKTAPCPIVDVRVIEVDGGKCEAWLDYCRLCIRKKNALVRFRLVDAGGTPIPQTGNYAFDDVLRGIEIDNPDAAGKLHFKDPVVEADKVRFRWLTGPDKTTGLAAQGLPHRARVERKSPAAACEPKDPIIVNTAN